MSKTKHFVSLEKYEYEVLSENGLISMACSSQLKTARKRGDEVKLHITLSALQDLIGFVAAEANHARTKRQSYDLNSICDHLEGVEMDIKNGFL